MSKRAESRFTSGRTAWVVAVGLSLGLAGCTAAIGAGVVAVGLTASAFALSCDDAIQVTVWDRASGRTVCDAVVVAVDADGDRVSFSPCYASYLGEGTWTVIATKPGHQSATSKVIVSDDKGCHPAIHTVELTLAPTSGAGAPVAPTPIPPSVGGGSAPPTAVSPSEAGGPPPAGPPPTQTPAPSAAPAASPAPPASAETPASPSPPTSAFPPTPAAPPTR